jgi:hypothetical protein
MKAIVERLPMRDPADLSALKLAFSKGRTLLCDISHLHQRFCSGRLCNPDQLRQQSQR